jgi:hypothetical protein
MCAGHFEDDHSGLALRDVSLGPLDTVIMGSNPVQGLESVLIFLCCVVLRW